MAMSKLALWLSTGLLVFCSVFHNPVSCDHAVPWGHLFNSSAVNSAKQVLKRTISTASRNEIQKFLDIAIVKDFMLQKRKSLIRGGGITETVQTTGGEIGKHVKFEKTGNLRLKEAFHFMQYYPLIYGRETNPTYFDVPIGSEYQRFKLRNRANGKFSVKAKHTTAGGASQFVDLSDLRTPVGALDDSRVKHPLRTTLQKVTIKSLDKKLASQPNFEQKLAANDPRNEVSTQERDEAFQAAKDVLAGSSILRKDLSGLNPASWLADVKTKVDDRMDLLAEDFSRDLKNEKNTKLRYEFTQSLLLSAEQAKGEWERLKRLKTTLRNGQRKPIIEERTLGKKGSRYKVVKIHENSEVSLKKIFKLLQFYNDIYDFQQRPQRQTHFEVPIGGATRRFRLSKSNPRRGGKHQIVVTTDDRVWANTDRRPPKPGKRYNPVTAPDYDTIVDNYLANADHSKLAKAMQKALDKKLDNQPSFADKLKVGGQSSPNTVRAAVEFMIISMIAEAAQPPQKIKAKFLTDVLRIVRRKKRFSKAHELPSLSTLTEKGGRSPAMDQVVQGMLKDVNTLSKIDAIFTEANFPARKKNGGTKAGREFIHREGNRDVPTYLIRKRAAADHDGDVIFRKVARLCSEKRRRRRRSVCKLTDKDAVQVDEESIKVSENMVELDVVDRRDSKLRDHVEFPLRSQELATPKLIKDQIAKSRRAGASKSYTKINKGLAVHGLVFSVLGAADYFNKGDYLRGSISLTQAAHTFGGLTGLNEIVSKLGKHVLSSAAKSLAKGLNFERGLERFSSKVERFMEKGVGKLLGDIPGVGLAFDVYFIEQDIEQLADLDFSDPDDLKLVPLRVIDLVLDVSSTALNLLGTFCPEAEVVTEPVIIILSIIRMAIDDFYIDIMAEMEKVQWNSPWAGLQFLAALVKGILDGVADFLTGGLRRQLDSYERQEKYDKELLRNLTNPENYFKIVGNKKGKSGTIDFTQGRLSSFGGYINFRLHDNNLATVEIGDVNGNYETKRETFNVDSSLKDIVLGLGESRSFTYKHETAKLWFVIPIKSFDVICGAHLHENSAYGTYYGNSDNNTFYAVQRPKPTTKPPGKKDEECNFGKLDLKMLTGNYHYNLYGRGGSDTFYLGPELSTVTGGSESDVYFIQSDGGKTIIDNFAEDAKQDIVVINVDYANIRCHRTGTSDVDVTYSMSHHIRIKNWFTQGYATYYRHVSFRSRDGVIFLAEQTSSSASNPEITCVAVAVDFSGANTSKTVHLSDPPYEKVKQASGSNSSDTIVGNDLSNVLDGGRGDDVLTGGKGEDTYVIRGNEGCDTINNDAEDYLNTTDIVIFDVPFDRIDMQFTINDLSVTDRNNPSGSCFTVINWKIGYQHRHMLFTSSDHVVFNVTSFQSGDSIIPTKVPMMLDYSASLTGVCVDVSDMPALPRCIKPTGYTNVATISDSPHNDFIIGNKQTNFLSCSGGEDYLEGGQGSDNYVVKKGCRHATINNSDNRTKDDVMYLEEMFGNLRASRNGSHLKIITTHGTPTVSLLGWFDSVYNQHLWIRTVDGVTLRINNETARLDPTEVSKDPVECSCKKVNCQQGLVIYNLTHDPWKHLVRFQLNSSHCSYRIYGNELNNYLDPGAGNGYNYQYLEGRNGSDTYVLNHGYGEFNEINNFAVDNKTDALHIGLEFNDIAVYFHGENDVILESLSKPSSLGIIIRSYYLNANYQHLQVVTTDKIAFEISKDVPFKNIISIDRTDLDNPQNINPDKDGILASAEDLKGSLSSANDLTGSNTTRMIEGGNMADVLRTGSTGTTFEGKDGNDKIYGGPGDDIIFGGDGDDHIVAGAGDDFIYTGNGRDVIDGGNGSDTVSFKGDGFERRGVSIDLLFGFGKGVDSEGDEYISIENVYGTIHNDTLTGSDSDNSLFGLEGNDTLIAHGGNDKLVGGEGDDMYLLYQAWGIKIIDNYADDETEDTLSLIHLNSTNVCVFLLDDDLHLQVRDLDLAAELFHSQGLTIIIQNWNVSAKYKHLSIAFNDTLWQSFALSEIASKIDQLNRSVTFIAEDSGLGVVSSDGTEVTLSWDQPDQGVLLHPNTELLLVNLSTTDPSGIGKTPVNGRTSITVASLNASLHYVFALALEKCNATLAVSHTLTTYGQRRSCAVINVPHSTVQYSSSSSGSSVGHGTTAVLTCSGGYAITHDSDTVQNTTCLDNQWIPSLPTCSRIRRCPSLSKPSNGEVSSDGLMEGSKALYVCKKGFLLQGPRERTCIGESWDGSNPRCQPLHCPKLSLIDNGWFRPCRHMGHAQGFGTMDNPLQGYCVRLRCSNRYLPSHRFQGRTHRPRWESDWKIPQGGRVCNDGKWIGYVDDKCELTVRLTRVKDHWNKKVGTLELWQNKSWRAASVAPDDSLARLSCKAVGLPHSLNVSLRWTQYSRIRITCFKLRLTENPTPYLGRVEVASPRGIWEGVCVSIDLQSASKEICESLGLSGYRSAVVSLESGWTDHDLSCPSLTDQPSPLTSRREHMMDLTSGSTKKPRCTLVSRRQHCVTGVQCRQRCSNEFPVPQGWITCTGVQGQFEGDTCTVECGRHFRRRGDPKAFCTGGVWTSQMGGGRLASAKCISVDQLFRADVRSLIIDNRGLSFRGLAELIKVRLSNKYPESWWVVTIYSPVWGWSNHAVTGYYYHEFRFDGERLNFVVSRYPKEKACRPRRPLSDIVGTENGDDAREAMDNIERKFGENNEDSYLVHVMRKRSGREFAFSWLISTENILYREFRNFVVIVVGPNGCVDI